MVFDCQIHRFDVNTILIRGDHQIIIPALKKMFCYVETVYGKFFFQGKIADFCGYHKGIKLLCALDSLCVCAFYVIAFMVKLGLFC